MTNKAFHLFFLLYVVAQMIIKVPRVQMLCWLNLTKCLYLHPPNASGLHGAVFYPHYLSFYVNLVFVREPASTEMIRKTGPVAVLMHNKLK